LSEKIILIGKFLSKNAKFRLKSYIYPTTLLFMIHQMAAPISDFAFYRIASVLVTTLATL